MLRILACILLLISGASAAPSCSKPPQCPGASNCCCSDYSSNDPLYPSYTECPCMVSRSSQVTVGEVTRITCNPGFGCYEVCEWETPQGNCTVRDNRLVCEYGVTGLTYRGGIGSCDVDVLISAEHAGHWNCKVRITNTGTFVFRIISYFYFYLAFRENY